MSVTMEQAIAELKKSPLADPEARMNAKGRRLVLAEIERVRARSIRAHVLIAPGTIDVAALWRALGYGERDALLVLHDGGLEVWLAGGKHSTVTAAAGVTIADLVLGELRHLAPPAATAKHDDDSGGGFPVLPVLGGTVVALGGGLVALAIVRRGKLAKEGLTAVAKAKAALDKSYADVVLACEELPGDPQASEIQLKAAELKKRGDAISAEVDAAPSRGTDPVTIGKLEQLDNELAALRSTVMQKARKQ
jgi:hypothetical protein